MTRPMPPPTSVPADEQPAATCPYCERPFATEAARDLHVGEWHPEACTDAEWTAYVAADEAEQGEMFYFHLKVVFALGVTNAALILAYLIVLG